MWGATRHRFHKSQFLAVSIHAPVWGATRHCQQNICGHCFNPRTRVGCDIAHPLQAIETMFQSTHPCGVRQLGDNEFVTRWVSIHAPVWGATMVFLLLSLVLCFNPRTRVGCDPCGTVILVNTNVSIHAPVWGATCR